MHIIAWWGTVLATLYPKQIYIVQTQLKQNFPEKPKNMSTSHTNKCERLFLETQQNPTTKYSTQMNVTPFSFHFEQRVYMEQAKNVQKQSQRCIQELTAKTKINLILKVHKFSQFLNLVNLRTH